MTQLAATQLLAEVESTDLKKAVNLVYKAIPKRTSTPVLAYMLLASNGQTLGLVGYDLNSSTCVTVPCANTRPGAIALDAALLKKWLAKAKKGTITTILFDPDNVIATLSDGKGSQTIKGIDAGEYPLLPTEGNLQASFALNKSELDRCIKSVLPSLSKDNFKPLLAGINLRSDGDGWLIIQATDGHTLSQHALKCEDYQIINAVIPPCLFDDLKQCDSDNIQLDVLDEYAILSLGTIRKTARLIEGKYPDIPKVDAQHQLQIDREVLKTQMEI